MPDETKKFYGKYRGTVMNNVDPMQMGRIQAIVPDVLGPIPTSFAMPCLPITGKQMGTFMLPQIGSGVWIEFEQGNPDYPIWTGGYWGLAAELPLAALAGNPAAPSLIFQSTLQNAVMISDLPPAPPPPVMPPVPTTGGIILRSTTGASIVVNDAGIFISNGKGAIISMMGPTILVNNGALMIV
jgi:type VI secretion system (T6SS) baseplate-like injector VgrG